MDEKVETRRKALRDAMQFEMDGRAFFVEAAGKTSDYFGRIIFNSLADDELEHIEKIRAIDRSLMKGETWPPSGDHVTKERRNIFETARTQLDEIVKDRTDDLQAVKIAMDLEQKGFRFYSDLARMAADKSEKEFYQRLASEERRHLQLLEDTWRTLVDYNSSSLE